MTTIYVRTIPVLTVTVSSPQNAVMTIILVLVIFASVVTALTDLKIVTVMMIVLTKVVTANGEFVIPVDVTITIVFVNPKIAAPMTLVLPKATAMNHLACVSRHLKTVTITISVL